MIEENNELNSHKTQKIAEASTNKSFFIKEQNSNSSSNHINSNIKPFESQTKYMSNGRINESNTNPNAKTTIFPKKSHHRKRLKVNLTEDEEIYYYNLFESLDIKNKGKLDSKEAAAFMKKSNLSKDALKNIWLIASQKSINHIERDEFYVALRLIALAQNNLPYDVENIENNTPIPPLPTFKYKIKDSDRIKYKISENNKIQYKRLFDNSKDKETDETIIARKAITIWKSTNASDDFIRQIAAILTPLEQKGHFNLKEFQVATYLCYINDKYEIPNKLPLSLSHFLGRSDNNSNSNINNESSINNNNNNIDKNSYSMNNVNLSQCNNIECLSYINEAVRRAKELNIENEKIEQKIINAKNKIKNLLEEIDELQREKNTVKEKLNYICQGCSDLIDFINNNQNRNANNNNNTINVNNINTNNNNANVIDNKEQNNNNEQENYNEQQDNNIINGDEKKNQKILYL